MNKKRLIVTSAISIILVSILFIGNTYSVFTTTSPDEEINSYKTGNLDIEVIGNNNKIENILPIKEAKNDELNPYRITIKNKGTIPYQFNVILEETTTSNGIDHKYIMTRVGTLKPISLSETDNNILKKDVVILPEETIDIDIRVWISDKISNSEMNKSFFARIKIDGAAVQDKKIKQDNNVLINPSKEQMDSENQNQQSDNKEIEQLPQ